MRPGGRARIDRCGAACGGRDCDRSIDEFRWLDATEVAGLISAVSVSVEEVLEASLARVEALNPSLNAVIAPMFDQARGDASVAKLKGPFGGVPFLVKDLMCEVAGVPLQSRHPAIYSVRSIDSIAR